MTAMNATAEMGGQASTVKPVRPTNITACTYYHPYALVVFLWRPFSMLSLVSLICTLCLQYNSVIFASINSSFLSRLAYCTTPHGPCFNSNVGLFTVLAYCTPHGPCFKPNVILFTVLAYCTVLFQAQCEIIYIVG